MNKFSFAAISDSKKVDVTPTWSGVVDMIVHLIENGDCNSKAVAVEQLRQMAKSADATITLAHGTHGAFTKENRS